MKKEPSIPDIKAGVYKYKQEYYLLQLICRNHYTGEPMIAYTPLYIREDRTGPRTSLRTVDDFVSNFEYVGPGYKEESGPS